MAVLVEALYLFQSLGSVDGSSHVGFGRINNVERLVVRSSIGSAAPLTDPVAHGHVYRVALALLGRVLGLVVKAHTLGVNRILCATGSLDS